MDNLFKTFFNLINTTRWDVKDVTNRDQCFDLITGWAKMLGLPDTIFNGILYAKNLYLAPTFVMRDNFDFIPNTPLGIPDVGDIVVFDGPVGHTSISTGKGNIVLFDTFDQNYPTGSECKVVTHNYLNPKVLGWLRYKKSLPASGDVTVLLQKIEDMKQTEIRLTAEKTTLQKEMDTKLAEKQRLCEQKITDIKLKITNFIQTL